MSSRPFVSNHTSLTRPRWTLGDYVSRGLIALVVTGMLTTITVLVGHVSVISGRRDAPDRPWNVAVDNSFLQIAPLGAMELGDVREAKLETLSGRKNSGNTYRVLLVTPAGEFPTTSFARGGRDAHQALVDRINANLRDAKATSFSVRHVGAGWFAIVPAAVLAGVAGALLIWAARRAISLANFWPAEEVVRT